MLTQHILENQCRIIRLSKPQKWQVVGEQGDSELFSLSLMLKTLNLAESLAYKRVCFNTPCWFMTQFQKSAPTPSEQSTPLSPHPTP
jgi:hypothetical protein